MERELSVRKWDVLDVVRRERGARSLVQILSASTGPDMHGRPELTRFGRVVTLLHATDQQRREWPETRGLPMLTELENYARRTRLRSDMVFIDSWHSYEETVRSLRMALRMLSSGGAIVIHDCDPPTSEAATTAPLSLETLWCGHAWRAFVDVTKCLGPTVATWFVVESDLGVGVITIAPRSGLRRIRPLPVLASIVPSEETAAWAWFEQHRESALRPLSVQQWNERAAAAPVA